MDHHDDDNRWDYDCPQFVDFTVPMPFNDGADQMFESAIIGEGPSAATSQLLSQGHEQETAKNREDPPAEQTEKATEEVKKPKQPANIVTSLDKWRNPKKHGSTGPDESPNSKKCRKNAEKTQAETQKTTAAASTLTRSKSLRITKSSSASTLHTDKAEAAAGPSGSRPRRSHSSTFSQGRSRRNSVDMGQDAKTKGGSSTTECQAKVPSLLKRLGERLTSSSKLKSSEEIEMERIKQLRKEMQHKRLMAQESYKKTKSGAMPVVVHHFKDPTVPQEFHFQTDKRLKSQSDKSEERGAAAGNFVKSLRSRTVVSPGPSTSAPKKLTVPQPFHLTEKYNSKGPQASADSKFESLAEKVTAFHKKTPDRFRARGRSGEKTHEQGARSTSPASTKLTQPHTPHLTARTRSRPVHFLSQEQLEMQEADEMKKNQFKARPVNTKILANPGIGVKKVPTKPPTEFEEFTLSADSQKKRKEEEDNFFEFHAKPINKKILEGIVGVKPVKPADPTVPQSPAFALKHRVRLPVELPEEKVEHGAPARAKPVPHTGIPFQPKLPHQHTVPEPFSVEERSKAMLAQKEEKIRLILEEEKRAREFHAQPLPSHDPMLPEKVVKEPTRPEPFQLETDERGTYYAQELGHKVGRIQLTEEEEEQRKAAEFRAQPNRTIYKRPFIPEKSTKALTDISDFELNSDRRAMDREEFEMRKKEREVELEGHRRQREQRDKVEEEMAIAKLRAEMVHRSNPIRRYPPMVIKPSDKPLTEAESPQFSDKLRAKVRL
ncbi:hypothetical protein ACOMHN_008414 [Nucella lapillus]